MANYLSSGRVNISLLRDDARRLLLECLDKCGETKVIIWDKKLVGPFGLISEYVMLKEHGVQEMFELKPNFFPNISIQNIIFLVQPRLDAMTVIADFVHKYDELKLKKEFHIIFVPRRSLLCEMKLINKGTFGNFVNVLEYPLELFPFDSDVLSMERELAFKECYIENDMTSMYHAAKALMTIQSIYGLIPNIYGKGKCAKHVYDLMTRMRRDLSGNDPQLTPQIDCLLLLDRSVDLLSLLPTQLTYEGLLDEIYGIKNNSTHLPPEKFAEPGGGQVIPSVPKSITLNSGESLYAELRDKSFNAVLKIFSQKAKLHQAKKEELQKHTIEEMKHFVQKQLPHLTAEKKSLCTHTSIAELIKEVTDSESFHNTLMVEQDFMRGFETDKVNMYIEDCIAKQEPLEKVLRLICMQCIINNGLKPKVLDFYKHEIIQTYGYQHFLSLCNLEKAGLLKLQGNKVYSVIKKTMNLIVEDVDEQSPSDINFVHCIYAPLSIRLAQFLNQHGWRAIPDVLKILPGPTVEEVQDIPPVLRKRRGSGSSIQSSTDDKKVTLVFFLGGCTFAEISALRFLSEQEDSPTEYLIATTKLVNGRTFLESLYEPLKLPS